MRTLAGVIACSILAISCAHAPPAKPQAAPPVAEEAPPPPPREPTGPDVVIGAYLPLTGAESEFGRAVLNGIELAIAEQNRAGGVRGRRLALRALDTTGRSSQAAEAVTRLVTNEGAIALLGDVSSASSLAGAVVAQRLGVPMISPSATNPAVTQVGDMISRACVSDEDQAIAMATFARVRLKLSRVAVLYDRTQPYSSGLATAFDRAFTRLGGTIAVSRAFRDVDVDLQPQLEAIRNAGVEAVFAPVYYVPAATIAKQLRDLGLAAPLLGSDGWDSPDLAQLAGAAIDGGFYTSSFAADDPRPLVKSFVKRYREQHGAEPDALAALGYDSARLLFSALGRARLRPGADLAAAIASTKNFAGTTGSLTMRPGREPKKSIAVLQIKAGKPTFVELVLPP